MTALTAAAATLAAFNLTCTVTLESMAGEFPKKPETAFNPAFRIDLAARRFCQGACSETAPIAEITDTKLTLIRAKTGRLWQLIEINRESGAYLSQIQVGDGQPSTFYGTCEPSAFTGFPVKRF